MGTLSRRAAPVQSQPPVGTVAHTGQRWLVRAGHNVRPPLDTK